MFMAQRIPVFVKDGIWPEIKLPKRPNLNFS